MQVQTEKIIIIAPADREMIACIKKAACLHFDIEEERLLDDSAPTVANIRFLCWWLIKNNSQVKDYAIASLFKKKRTVVNYGIDQIEAHRFHYRQTLDNLRKMGELANNFEKNYAWHIQPIKSTN